MLVRRIAVLLRRVERALRAIAGAPDYERYVAHLRARHPGQSPMSESEFVRRRLDERYARPGTRCC